MGKRDFQACGGAALRLPSLQICMHLCGSVRPNTHLCTRLRMQCIHALGARTYVYSYIHVYPNRHLDRGRGGPREKTLLSILSQEFQTFSVVAPLECLPLTLVLSVSALLPIETERKRISMFSQWHAQIRVYGGICFKRN